MMKNLHKYARKKAILQLIKVYKANKMLSSIRGEYNGW